MPTLIMNLYQSVRIMYAGTSKEMPVRVKKVAMRDTRGLHAPSVLCASPKLILPVEE